MLIHVLPSQSQILNIGEEEKNNTRKNLDLLVEKAWLE